MPYFTLIVILNCKTVQMITQSHNQAHISTQQTLEAEGMALVDWFAANQMEANPDKCQGIAVGKKAYTLKPTFNILGADIECTDDVKLLGVTIDYQMNFDKNISNLFKKAARQINVLRRIGKYLTVNCRKVIYQAFIESAFNFCPVIWHFCSEANTKKLEKLNYGALRHVYKDYDSDYEEILAKDKSIPLQLNRMRQVTLDMYKILSKQCPCYQYDMIKPIKETGNNMRKMNVDAPSFKTITYGKNVSSIGAPYCGMTCLNACKLPKTIIFLRS